MTIGFGRGCEEGETSEPSHIGDVGQLTTTSDEADEGTLSFRSSRILLAVQLGPFSFVIGAHE